MLITVFQRQQSKDYMSNLYSVQAKIKDSEEPSGYRTIWSFHAICATSTHHAINECKWSMKKIMGTISDYIWFAELEWENNLAVN
jgi:hypothetical protein